MCLHKMSLNSKQLACVVDVLKILNANKKLIIVLYMVNLNLMNKYDSLMNK